MKAWRQLAGNPTVRKQLAESRLNDKSIPEAQRLDEASRTMVTGPARVRLGKYLKSHMHKVPSVAGELVQKLLLRSPDFRAALAVGKLHSEFKAAQRAGRLS